MSRAAKLKTIENELLQLRQMVANERPPPVSPRAATKDRVEVSPTFLSRTFLRNNYFEMNTFSRTAKQNMNFIVA